MKNLFCHLLGVIILFSVMPLNAQTVEDIDGNAYNTVKIGNHVWLKENLKATRYNDGTSIPCVTDDLTWDKLSSPAYCWYNNDFENYGNFYGALYNWFAINSNTNGGRNVCPIGWHVSTNDERFSMETFLLGNLADNDGSGMIGDPVEMDFAKALASTTSWTVSSDTGVVGNIDYPDKRNISGFTALPGGWRTKGGAFGEISNYGCWWMADEFNNERGYFYIILSNSSNPGLYGAFKSYGCSVRCVQD
jgi:uncharacterized protein (TIGR02145 family)